MRYGATASVVLTSHLERQLDTFVLNNVFGGRASVVNVWGNAAALLSTLSFLLSPLTHFSPLSSLLYDLSRLSLARPTCLLFS